MRLTEMITFLLIALAFIGVLVLSYFADKKFDLKEQQKVEEERAKWLEEQMALPQYKVSVTTKNGTVFNTGPFKPKAKTGYYGIIGHILDKDTSKEIAEAFIEIQIRSGRYHDNNGTYTPMCEIESMKILEDK